jgi:hypothetical protein
VASKKLERMTDTAKLRQSIEALVKLSEESWQKIVASFKIKDFSKGNILLREGQINCLCRAFIKVLALIPNIE